ncbi:GntR family transcriptional regulator [Streptomyces griseorubiginosus]|uniref:GntR family transcriptional regulator n=1 Tax=Streptomyces griseorubiginosus TaxID=67304 RepID=UPI0011407B33|nr:GntR family transcriptional regulator [Streptomyces griseorubiginosus]
MSQDELARRFGAAITPVREALRLLDAEGLVVAEPQRGISVAGVDLGRMKGICLMSRLAERHGLAESHAMERATLRLSRRHLSASSELLDRLQRRETDGDRGARRA